MSYNVSRNFKPDHLSLATPGDSHILVDPGVGFSFPCLTRGSAREGLKSEIKLDNFEKSSIFAVSLMYQSVPTLTICPRATIFLPRGSGFGTFFMPGGWGVGNSPWQFILKKERKIYTHGRSWIRPVGLCHQKHLASKLISLRNHN